MGLEFYKPRQGWVGDVIPFVDNDELNLFFLHDLRTSPPTGTSWARLITKDLSVFDEKGDVLQHGTHLEQDFNAYTGSVVKDVNGLFHLFYTGHNPQITGSTGHPVQIVMHAVSTDLQHWIKKPEYSFGATSGYESSDWRDPFVFRDEERGCWRMLLAARHTEGPARRRGVVAQCISHDLLNWQVVSPLWDPERFITQECPEVFKWGDWWYLVYSEFSDSFATRYRISKSLDGPWIAPDNDKIDGRAFYAAKTALINGRRIFFGWIPTREGGSDDSYWQWAGNLSFVEAFQCSNGFLRFSIPQEIISEYELESTSNSCRIWKDVGSCDGYRSILFNGFIQGESLISVHFIIYDEKADCGILLNSSDDGDKSWIIRLEPKLNRMVLDRWPRLRTGDDEWQISGDVPFLIESERPCTLNPGEHVLTCILHDDMLVANLDERVIMHARIETFWGRRIGFFSNNGRTKIVSYSVRQEKR